MAGKTKPATRKNKTIDKQKIFKAKFGEDSQLSETVAEHYVVI